MICISGNLLSAISEKRDFERPPEKTRVNMQLTFVLPLIIERLINYLPLKWFSNAIHIKSVITH